MFYLCLRHGAECLQARTIIAKNDWAPLDGDYDYQKLFKAIVALFASDDPWVTETLEWYQLYVVVLILT